MRATPRGYRFDPKAEEADRPTIFVANILAATAMLSYFLARHPGLTRRLSERWAEAE
jgi:hypothetical protein